jgi:APA family basic amino acid/polyamine antiporter
MYGVGLTLGAGIYVLIGEAAGFAGNSVWISFILAAIVAVFAGLSYAELTALFPKAAAEYVFVKNAFKNNFIAFIIGWLTAITSMITAATVALGFGGYFTEFVGTISLDEYYFCNNYCSWSWINHFFRCDFWFSRTC